MKGNPFEHFHSLLEEVVRTSMDAYLAYVDDLIHDKPTAASDAAEWISPLSVFLDHPDRRAEALGLAASAFIVGRRFRRAELHLDEAERLTSNPLTTALLASRRAHLFHLQRDWNRTRTIVEAGLDQLVGFDSTEGEAIRARLEVQAGCVELGTGHPLRAAVLLVRVLHNPAASPRVHTAALTNLTTALGHVDHRRALAFLETFHTWSRKPNANLADYYLGWLDGLFRVMTADESDDPGERTEKRRQGRHRLQWVAEGLYALGRRGEAVTALTDLLAYGYQERRAQGHSATLAQRILEDIERDPEIAEEVRIEATQYLRTRRHAHAVRLRAAVRSHLHSGILPRRRARS